MTEKRIFTWKTIGVKPEIKKELLIACDFLRISQSEFIEYALEMIGFTDIKPRTAPAKNPFLNNDFRTDLRLNYEKYKLSRLGNNSSIKD